MKNIVLLTLINSTVPEIKPNNKLTASCLMNTNEYFLISAEQKSSRTRNLTSLINRKKIPIVHQFLQPPMATVSKTNK